MKDLDDAENAYQRAADMVAGRLKRPSVPLFAFSVLAAGGDIFAISLSLWFAAYATVMGGFTPVATMALASGTAVALSALLFFNGGYGFRTLTRPVKSTSIAWCATMAGATVMGGAAPVITDLPGFLAAVALLGALSLALSHGVVGFIARWAQDLGLTDRFAVIVGGGSDAAGVIDTIRNDGLKNIQIVGLFDDRTDDRSPDSVFGIPKLGMTSQLLDFARRAEIDMVIIAFPLDAKGRIRETVELLKVLPIDIRLPGFTNRVSLESLGADTGAQPPLIALAKRPMTRESAFGKRFLDLILTCAALVCLAPVMVLLGLAVRLDSPGPALFRQKRLGYNNKVIEILKFRSMYVDDCDYDARKVVQRGDPRVTRVGRVLRRLSLDELPQLINVLKGDLSLVGPRPHVVDAVYSEEIPFDALVSGYAARHRVPPGITGWAQINGWRGEIDNPDRLLRRVEHDLYYIENRNLWFDLYILTKTLPALVQKSDYAF